MLQVQAIPTIPGVRYARVRVACAHRRMIDDVLTEDGAKTGMVRCLECLAVIPDPYLRRAIG